MSSGEPPTGPSAARIGGLALIGVGALAGLIGVVTVASGGVQNSAQEAPTPPPSAPAASTVPTPPASSAAPEPQNPTDSAAPPVPSAPPGSTSPGRPDRWPAGQQPPAPKPDPRPQPPDNPSPGREKIAVRIYNNSTVRGLAHRAAEDFRRAGYAVVEVGNYSQGRIYTTTVYFRPGTREEALAREVAARFGARVEPRFKGIEHASPGIIVIVTKDYKGPVAGGK